MTDKDQDKDTQTEISDLPDKAEPSTDDESIKGGRMKADPPETSHGIPVPGVGGQG